MAAVGARTAASVAWERLAVRDVERLDEVPPRIEAVTPAWLSAALCGGHPGARVEEVTFGPGSSGTSVRRQLLLTYNAAGRDAGLPPSLFAKSTPTVLTRIANGASGTTAAEAGFYREIRPAIEVEAPRGYHSAFESRSLRSIHLLEDLVATRGASFCTPTTPISRAQAEQIVTNLAALHSAAGVRRFVEAPPPWVRTYATWWEWGLTAANVRRYHLKGFADASEVVPDELHGRGGDLFQLFVRSVASHGGLPPTLIHNDVHLGNWYVTGDGAMGLCDWQCVCIGHGSRDLAYALVTTLPVDDRRAWERELVALYVERLRSLGADPGSRDDTWDRYRQQIVGALLMWTPTHSPPPLLPDMQPREVSREMIRRISTAILDHEVL
jgi:aminoglycoside phosphotransferase (APT) family kinase protein